MRNEIAVDNLALCIDSMTGPGIQGLSGGVWILPAGFWAGWDLNRFGFDEGDTTTMKLYMRLMMVIGISILLACAGTQSGGTGPETDGIQITPRQLKDVAGMEWHLIIMKIDNESIALIEDTKNTFSCDENGKVAGVASLNRYFGNFSLQENGEIIWSKAFGMTRMAGPPELMAQETKFMQALLQTSRIYLKKETLLLISADNSTVLEFQEN